MKEDVCTDISGLRDFSIKVKLLSDHPSDISLLTSGKTLHPELSDLGNKQTHTNKTGRLVKYRRGNE